MSFTTMTIGDLCVSPYNVRKDQHAIDAVEGMAESLLARGQLYPLVVHPMPPVAGGGKPKARGRQKQIYGAFAGGRRYRAFKLLIEQGRLPADHPIDVIVRDITDEGELVDLSLAENLVRVDLRPYEVFAAVHRAHASGRSLAEIADTNGQTLRTVRQWARLGALEPGIFAALERGEISQDQARAFAATEDVDLQRRAFQTFMSWSSYDRGYPHSVQAIRRLLKIGDREAETLLRFVTEKAYRDAGGRYELDLFADEAEQRGRVIDEGLLARLAEEKLQAVRDRLRGQAGRDLRFASEYPRDANYGGTASDLEITPQWMPLPPERAARLEQLGEEMVELEARARRILSDEPDGPARDAAIAEIDADYVPMEREREAIEAEQRLVLPEGDIFGTLIVEPDGELEIRWWWASRKAWRAAQGIEAASRTVALPGGRPLGDGEAMADRHSPAAREADASIREDLGLSKEGIEIFRSLRREVLRAILVREARNDQLSGDLAQDYLIWSLARDRLRDPFSYRQGGPTGMAGLSVRHDALPPSVADHVGRTEAHRIWREALDALKAHDCMTLDDPEEAFDAFHTEDLIFKQVAAAIVVGCALDRSADADGYRIRMHDRLAWLAGHGADTRVRELVEPTEEMVALMPRAQRLAAAKGHATPVVQRAWEKAKAGEIAAPIARLLANLPGWVHPMIRFRRHKAGTLADVFEVAGTEEAAA